MGEWVSQSLSEWVSDYKQIYIYVDNLQFSTVSCCQGKSLGNERSAAKWASREHSTLKGDAVRSRFLSPDDFHRSCWHKSNVFNSKNLLRSLREKSKNKTFFAETRLQSKKNAKNEKGAKLPSYFITWCK